MIINNATIISTNDPCQYAWTHLRRFQHVPFVTDLHMRLRGLNKDQKHNAKKQAEQIRYCLQQAQEYHQAAEAVSLVTKPVLYYYSLMSLALAEILLKGTGDQSLDRGREHHNHHGLKLIVTASKEKELPLNQSGSLLGATPLIKDNQRFGTFALWHAVSREMPLVGEITQLLDSGVTTTQHRIVLSPDDRPFEPIPKGGYTLLDCLSHIPSMSEFLNSHAVAVPIVRGLVKILPQGLQQTISIVVHPSDQRCYEQFIGNCMVAPKDVELVNMVDMGNGAVITIQIPESAPSVIFSIPHASNVDTNEIRFWCNQVRLNEFGFFYMALYIAGNYVRYFPDKWISDLERSTPLALSIEQLCDKWRERGPLICLSEMSRSIHVLRA